MMKADPAGTLAIFRSLGVTRVRVGVPWNSLAPSPNSKKAPRNFKGGLPPHIPPPAGRSTTRSCATPRPTGSDLLPAHRRRAAVGQRPRACRRAATCSGSPTAVQFGAFAKAVGTRYSGDYKPKGQKRAAAGELLVDLERAQLRLRPRPADHQPRLGRGRARRLYRGLLGARLGRSGPERPQARQGHDPDRRACAARPRPRDRQLPGRQAAAVPARAVLRGLALQRASRLGGQRPRLPDRRHRGRAASASRTRGCSAPAGSPTTRTPRRPSRWRRTCRPA